MHDARLRANAKRSEEIRLQQRETGVTWMKQRGAVNRTSTNTLSELALAQLALSSFLWCFIYSEKLSNWVASCSHFLSQTETAAHGVLHSCFSTTQTIPHWHINWFCLVMSLTGTHFWCQVPLSFPSTSTFLDAYAFGFAPPPLCLFRLGLNF